jgi:hypothetical protein
MAGFALFEHNVSIRALERALKPVFRMFPSSLYRHVAGFFEPRFKPSPRPADPFKSSCFFLSKNGRPRASVAWLAHAVSLYGYAA